MREEFSVSRNPFLVRESFLIQKWLEEVDHE